MVITNCRKNQLKNTKDFIRIPLCSVSPAQILQLTDILIPSWPDLSGSGLVWSGLGDKSLEIIRCRRVSIKHNAHYIVHLKTGWRRCRRWQYLGYPLKHSSPRTIKPLFEQNGNLRKYFPKLFLIRPRRFNLIWIKNWLIDWRLPWHWE